MLWTQGILSPYKDKGANQIPASWSPWPPRFRPACGGLQRVSGILFILKHNDRFDQMDCLSLKTLGLRKKQHWGVKGRGLLLCCTLGCSGAGGTRCLHELWRGKGRRTKQPFSTTSVTVTRLYYLQMVIGLIIFIEQLFLFTCW